MKTIFRIISLSIILLTACYSEEKKLFRISESTGQENDFLFLAESTNVPEIKPDSLVLYLTKKEFLSTDKLTFKNFGEIYSNEEFEARILLKERSNKGRDYTFILRTFNSEFEIIDSYELAIWNDTENIHCYGSINENLIINKNCENGKNKDVMQIVNDGRIVATSFHGRE